MRRAPHRPPRLGGARVRQAGSGKRGGQASSYGPVSFPLGALLFQHLINRDSGFVCVC